MLWMLKVGARWMPVHALTVLLVAGRWLTYQRHAQAHGLQSQQVAVPLTAACFPTCMPLMQLQLEHSYQLSSAYQLFVGMCICFPCAR